MPNTESLTEHNGRYPLNVELPSLKAVFIEIRRGSQQLAIATATLLSNTRESHCALVTNRHNVTGRNQETGECLSKTLGVPDNIMIHFHRPRELVGSWKTVELPLYRDDGSPYWIEHPTLGEQADIVALNLNWGDDVLKLPFYLQGELDRVGMVVSPGEPLSVLGYPFGLTTVGKLPVWSTGFLAQELSLINKDSPTFLIDCRTRQGQSGSPVIAFRPQGFRKIEGGKIHATLSVEAKWEFLGIYSGRVNKESDLGRVWHVSALHALLEAADQDYKARQKKA